jgi:hypothetical protein
MNAPQAQYGTAEQLEWLRAFYDSLNNKPQTVAALIRLANVQGLYDAADHVQRKAEIGVTNLIEMMTW